MPDASAAWELSATPAAVREMRHNAAAFAVAHGASEDLAHSVALAVSETVTNAVAHAYAGTEPGPVTVRCEVEDGRFVVEVSDEGTGLAERRDSPGIGYGLAMAGALAQSLEVTAAAGGRGTTVRMAFGEAAAPPEVRGLEPLCRLALERVADVSCLDLVSGGVLRRATAEVAGDPGLTAWLRDALPPSKPGTATWAALREGGARLVVHDPDVPRSPGGTGEQLGLVWWVSVALDGPDGRPAAIWGLGGRSGGRPVPGEAVLSALAAAARDDLAGEPGRERLRAQLAGSTPDGPTSPPVRGTGPTTSS